MNGYSQCLELSGTFSIILPCFTACYQLAQFVLKIGSVLAERVGQEEVGEYTPLGDSAWRLLQLAVEKPWSAGWLFVCFLA